jgi:hypothetical protein
LRADGADTGVVISLFIHLVLAVLASAGAVVSYEVWTAAKANSASPGAIVLLGIAGFCGLIAFLACIVVVVELVRFLRGEEHASR